MVRISGLQASIFSSYKWFALSETDMAPDVSMLYTRE